MFTTLLMKEIRETIIAGKFVIATMLCLKMTGYHRITVRDALGSEWIDILLLAMYTMLFFAVSFVKFLRYDVR